MNRPTEPNEILAMPDTERDAYAAEVCMGWEERLDEVTPCMDYWCDDEYVMDLDDYQPSQPTEKGIAQCWGLAEKYELEIEFEDDCVHYKDYSQPNEERDYAWETIIHKNKQVAVVAAAILCAIQRKNND